MINQQNPSPQWKEQKLNSAEKTNNIFDGLETDVEEADSIQNINFINNLTPRSFSPFSPDKCSQIQSFSQSYDLYTQMSQDSSSNASFSVDLKSDDYQYNKQNDVLEQQFLQDQSNQVMSYKAKSYFNKLSNSCVENSKSVNNNYQNSKFNNSQDQELSPRQMDELEILNKNLSNMDFYGIRNKQIVQLLIQTESSNLKRYFFSELTAKISSSGKKKSRVLFITINCIYILKSLSSYRGVKKFDINNIKMVKFHSENVNLCSFFGKNNFKSSLIINHKSEFIQFIQFIFNKDKIDQYKMEKFLQNQQAQFYVQITKMTIESDNNKNNPQVQVQGLLQFLGKSICLTAYSDFYRDLSRLALVELLEINQQRNNFTFKSIKNSSNKYIIKLQNDKELSSFMNQLSNL